MPSVRYPAVAGAFYPGDRFKLNQTVAGLLPKGGQALPAAAVVVPHAGYIYSGACAGKTLAGVAIPSTVILLGPNHTGRGVPLAAAAAERWTMPLGPVPVDQELLSELVLRCGGLEFDAAAHKSEHSLEVQLPLLYALRADLSVAPIVVGTADPVQLLALGEALAELISARDEAPLILVSSDMTHYESAVSAREKDLDAIARMEEIDPEGLLRTVQSRGLSMCGVAPATAALVALRRLGVTRGETVCYTHSGLVTGDEREVVAYAGMVFRA